MYKLVGDEPKSARNFYPKPDFVWVRQLGDDMAFVDTRAEEVEPAWDKITALGDAIFRKRGIVGLSAWGVCEPRGLLCISDGGYFAPPSFIWRNRSCDVLWRCPIAPSVVLIRKKCASSYE